MAFTALDAMLRDNMFNLAKQANFDLPFGGTTEAEFDFLSRNGAVNKMAPNFLSFLAGVQGANLATQQNRQLQFDRATKLRDQESNLAYRGALTRSALLQGDVTEAKLPFVGQQAEADLERTLLGNDAQDLENFYYPDVVESEIDFRDAQTAARETETRYLPQTIQSQNAYRDAQRNFQVARTAEQQFVNRNLQKREDLYRRDKEADITYRNAATANQNALQQLNQKKIDAFAEIDRLDRLLQQQKISRAQYDAQIAKKKADAFDAIREEGRLYNKARTDAQVALAEARRNPTARSSSGNEYYIPPTVINRQPTPRNPANQLTPPVTPVQPRSNFGTGAAYDPSTAIVPQPVNEPTQPDYSKAIGLPGITEAMVSLAQQGFMNGSAGRPVTKEELQAMMAVETALGLR